jgi:hypothetical protein
MAGSERCGGGGGVGAQRSVLRFNNTEKKGGRIAWPKTTSYSTNKTSRNTTIIIKTSRILVLVMSKVIGKSIIRFQTIILIFYFDHPKLYYEKERLALSQIGAT